MKLEQIPPVWHWCAACAANSTGALSRRRGAWLLGDAPRPATPPATPPARMCNVDAGPVRQRGESLTAPLCAPRVWLARRAPTLAGCQAMPTTSCPRPARGGRASRGTHCSCCTGAALLRVPRAPSAFTAPRAYLAGQSPPGATAARRKFVARASLQVWPRVYKCGRPYSPATATRCTHAQLATARGCKFDEECCRGPASCFVSVHVGRACRADKCGPAHHVGMATIFRAKST